MSADLLILVSACWSYCYRQRLPRKLFVSVVTRGGGTRNHDSDLSSLFEVLFFVLRKERAKNEKQFKKKLQN